MKENEIIIGIDLGTTNSVVAARSGQEYEVLRDDLGVTVHPSVVSFHPNGTTLVGQSAKQRRVIDPKHTVSSVKRLIGHPFSSKPVQEMSRRLAYEIVQGDNDQPLIKTRGGEFATTEITAMILGKMRGIAEAQLDHAIGSAVVTVPANFGDAQRSATATAGAIAGLQICRVLNEPTAAALAYGHMRNLKKTIAIYDFGGGTFDITLLHVDGANFKVLATAGDSFLGGDDVDERLVEIMADRFLRSSRIDLRHNELSLQRLRAVAEQAKIELSRRKKAMILVEEIAYGTNGKPINLELQITREELEKASMDLVQSTLPVCDEAFKLAGIKPSDIQDVLLVGGQTKMPLVREQVSQYFSKTPLADINPEEAVAMGASIQASAIARLRRPRPVPPPMPAPGNRTLPLGLQGRVSGVRKAEPGKQIDRFTAKKKITSPGAAIARIRPSRSPSLSTAPDFEDIETRPQDKIEELGRQVGAAKPEDNESAPITKELEPITKELLIPEPGAIGGAPKVRAPSIPPVNRGIPEFIPTPVNGMPVPDAALRTPSTGVNRMPIPAVIPESAIATPSRGIPAEIKRAASGKEDAVATIRRPAPPSGRHRAEQDTIIEAKAPSAQERSMVPPPSAAVSRTRSATMMPVIAEVTPRGLGIATVKGFCRELIARNSSIPAEKVCVFTNSRDDQTVVRIQVFQGESKRVSDNKNLGVLELTGLVPREKGLTRIEVSFQVDDSGILHVDAVDAETGQRAQAHLNIIGAQSLEEFEAARERFGQPHTST